MNDRTRWLALPALLTLCLLAAPAMAGDDEAGGGMEASMAASAKQLKAMVDGMQKLAGTTRLTEADVKLLLKHGPAFTAIGKDEAGNDEIDKALEAQYRKTGAYDFASILELAGFQAWGRKTGVDLKHFAAATLRVHVIEMRAQFLASVKEMRKELPKQLEQIEKMRSMMGEAAYKQAKQGLALQAKMADAMEATAKSIPQATDVEKKLLATHGAALKKALDMDDDDEGMDDDDRPGKDDEDGDDDDADDDDDGGR